MINTSPLETLASYAIAFVAGAISISIISAYGKWIKNKGEQH